MARIRTIKPEFPQSESVGRLSRDARLLFILLWTICDDQGRTRAASRVLASLLYPFDDDAPMLIERWLAELEAENMVRRYAVDGTTYLDIPKWLIHQKIDRPSKSHLPPFDEASRHPREASRSLDALPRTLDHGPRTMDRKKESQQRSTETVIPARETVEKSAPTAQKSPPNQPKAEVGAALRCLDAIKKIIGETPQNAVWHAGLIQSWLADGATQDDCEQAAKICMARNNPPRSLAYLGTIVADIKASRTAGLPAPSLRANGSAAARNPHDESFLVDRILREKAERDARVAAGKAA